MFLNELYTDLVVSVNQKYVFKHSQIQGMGVNCLFYEECNI